MTKELFEKITKWQDKTFPESTELSMLHHLKKELEELLNEAKAKEYLSESKRLEYADCFLLLFGAAQKAGFNYNRICVAINQKYEINKLRNWGEPDENGVVEHVG